MNKQECLVLLAITTMPLTAFAGSLHGCRELAALDKEVESCEQNQKYTEAAGLCVANFEAYLKPERAKALNVLASARAKADSRAESRQVLVRAAALAEATADRLGSYLGNIVYPEDFDAPEAMIGDRNAYLERETCYSSNRDRLEGMIERVKLSLRELNTANRR